MTTQWDGKHEHDNDYQPEPLAPIWGWALLVAWLVILLGTVYGLRLVYLFVL